MLPAVRNGGCIDLAHALEADVSGPAVGHVEPDDLVVAVALEGAPAIHALACDTDGIDGTEDNAGAIIGPETLARSQTLGLEAKAHLADNDGYGFFAALGDLVITGPTLTNVNDFRAILVTPQA